MKQYCDPIEVPVRRNRRFACALILVASAVGFAPLQARADFFDDARTTFTSDIPHFFQDDIPCAFGGQPTSHTKPTCNSKPNSEKQVRSTTTTTTTTKTTTYVEPTTTYEEPASAPTTRVQGQPLPPTNVEQH